MLKRAGIKIWILTGDKTETAVNIGYSCKLISPECKLTYITSESVSDIGSVLNDQIDNLNRNKDTNTSTCLVVDGSALKIAFSNEMFSNDFLRLAISCRTVICCRATPKDKAQVVEHIKLKTNEITLAIGDGANDVGMIQAAHVGIGIYGREGTQALSASDYAIGQFRFLSKLLLVHGIWNYKRLCKVILYSFYKNICLYVIEFWFAMSNGFSGQVLFDRWLIGFYNVFFTAVPPLAIGLFDRPSKSRTMLDYPELYKRTKSDFSIKMFWSWILNAFIHSVVLYFVCYGSLKHDIAFSDGKTGGYLFMGNHVYIYCVVIVCLKAGLESESWTLPTHISIWGSIGFCFFFIIIYSNFWVNIGISAEMSGMAANLLSGGIFWFGLILVPIFALVPDVSYKVLQRTLFKTESQAIQESEIYNRDVEPLIRSTLLTETARLLKNKFSFRKKAQSSPEPEQHYRGFAFSQEENGAVTQTNLIRAYGESNDTIIQNEDQNAKKVTRKIARI
jgi:phospholipid-transporting ATPase